jgi:hypothetical protein
MLLEDFDNKIVWFLENKNEFDPNLSIQSNFKNGECSVIPNCKICIIDSSINKCLLCNENFILSTPTSCTEVLFPNLIVNNQSVIPTTKNFYY